MNDTSPEIQARYGAELAALSPEERVKMACSMFEFAREIVAESILNEKPGIVEVELKKAILHRFYGDAFEEHTPGSNGI